MSTITIEVTDENVEIVMTLLNNLKTGLIQNVKINKEVVNQNTKYKPKGNQIIKENDSTQGKYMNAGAYQKRLKNK